MAVTLNVNHNPLVNWLANAELTVNVWYPLVLAKKTNDPSPWP